ncbi:MAG: hypothetical protein EHM13_15455, partial [Acidobacteria bacterium]
MYQLLRSLVHHDEGQDLLEYALLVALIAIIAFTAIAIAVAVLIIVMSVMNGFREQLLSRILGFS